MLIGLAAVALLGLAGFAARGSQTASADQPGASERPLTEEQLVSQLKTGWIQFADGRAEDPRTAFTGWVRADPDPAVAAKYQIEPGVTPVYDQPDGQVIGYAYALLGVVDPATYEAGTFDAAAARIDRWGCDALDRSSLEALKACDQSIHEGVREGRLPHLPEAAAAAEPGR